MENWNKNWKYLNSPKINESLGYWFVNQYKDTQIYTKEKKKVLQSGHSWIC